MLVEDVKKNLALYMDLNIDWSEKVQVLQILKVYLLTQVVTSQLTASQHCDLEATVDYYIYRLINS